MVFVVEGMREKCCFSLVWTQHTNTHTQRQSGAERAGSGLGLLLICFVMLVVSGLGF